MDQEQHAEWFTMQEAVCDQLRRRTERKGAITLVHLLIFPSFENSRGYQILRSKIEPRGGTLIRRVWRRDLDIEKFRTPVERLRHPRHLEPMLEENKLELRPDEVEALESEIKHLYLAARPERRRLGLDGTSYEMAFGDHWSGSRFNWWEQAPEAWEGLERLTQMILTIGDRGSEDASPTSSG